MTPAERAQKLQAELRRAGFDVWRWALLPPGSLILTAEEAEQVRGQVEKGHRDSQLLDGRSYDSKPWEAALALLAGEEA